MQLELTEQILKYIESHGKADTFDLAAEFSEDHQKVVGALKSIESHGELLNSETTSRKTWQVTDEGQYVIEHGSHEASVYNAIPVDGGISQPELMKVIAIFVKGYIVKISSFIFIDISKRQSWIQQGNVPWMDCHRQVTRCANCPQKGSID